MIARTATFAALLLVCATPALAQQHDGVYSVRGTETGRGAFSGQVELRWAGNGVYDLVRSVEYATFQFQGRPVTTVWTGVARQVQGGVDITCRLDRMGWISASTTTALTRSAADGTPLAVTGAFRLNASGLWNGIYRGQSASFVDRGETWTRAGPTGVAPIWTSERRVVPAHNPASPWLKRLLFAIFTTYHTRTPWISPYIARPEFNAGIHSWVFDRTDFAFHRARPRALRVIGRVVDDLTLLEAVAKADAFGTPLRDKAAGADAEIPALFLDPSGALARRTGGGALQADGDGVLWTGVYGYSQALRLRVTGDPVARANAEGVVRSVLTHMEISGRDDEFARTLRAATGQVGGRWAAGAGAFANLEWMVGGNNDMWKGLLWGGLTAHEVLAPSDPLRARYGQRLSRLTQAHPVGQKGRLGVKSNELMGSGLAALLTGDRADRRRYERQARNPFGMLYSLALGGGFFLQGISDWSGNHLEISSLIIQARLARHHNERLAGLVQRIALRRAARRFAPTRRSLHTIAAAALGGILGFRPVDVSDGVWGLREVPFPRLRGVATHHALRADVCASPYPNLPWKNDWTTDRGRARNLVAPPLFERNLRNYEWKNAPLIRLDGSGLDTTHHNSADILIAYWLGRAHGVIGPND